MSVRCAVLVDDHGWSVGVVRADGVVLHRCVVEGEVTVALLAESVARRLAEEKNEDEATLLAVPSSWCLCAVIGTSGLGRGGRRRAMGFRLEENLPIAAEDVVADYVEVGGDEALGVCAPVAKLKEVIDALTAAGVRVQHICPTALLAAAEAVGSDTTIHGVVLRSQQAHGGGAESVDVVEWHAGRPARWWWMADDGRALREQMAAWREEHGASPHVAVIGCDEATCRDLGIRESYAKGAIHEVGVEEAAARQAAKVLDGSATAWIDLRRERLAARDGGRAHASSMRWMAGAVMIALVLVSVAAWWRGGQYAELAEQSRDEQVRYFKAVLPGQRVPGSIRSRMQSERQRLAALGGESEGAGPMAEESALIQLHRILRSLPAGVPYRVLDMSIEPERVRLDGQSRSHVEAERLASELRQSGAYEVDPPRTQALREGGVSFVFTARPVGSRPASVEAPR